MKEVGPTNKRTGSGESPPPPPADPIAILDGIEESIAVTDRQRLHVLQTNYPAVVTALSNPNWEAVKQKHAVTTMIAKRMFNHYQSQKSLMEWLSCARMASASEVFQQAVGTYLRAYLAGVHSSFTVKLEKGYGKLHPDVAVEKNGRPVAAIEVKTDLGWHRDYIDDIDAGSWNLRQKDCLAHGFRSAYLLILANTNWKGRDELMAARGVHVLLKWNPNDQRKFKWYDDPNTPLDASDVLDPVEGLFETIGAMATDGALKNRPEGA